MPLSYKIYRNDRPSYGGGVAIAAKCDIEAVFMPSLPNNEALFCKINCLGNIVVLGVVSRPPSAEAKDLEDLFDYLGQVRVERVKLIMAGDFNLSHIGCGNMKTNGCSLLPFRSSFKYSRLV